MQQPSSLIFLVIIAVWAVYFVQYWVRRREHLATARSVDQFSESLRVLERRTPLPATDLSTSLRPSYAVSPARAARPQVLVTRAEPAPVLPAARPAAVPLVAVSPSRRVRGLVLLASLASVPVLAVCALLGVVPVWSLGAAAVAVGGSVAWLRVAVSVERAARAASRAPSRRPAARPEPVAPVRHREVQHVEALPAETSVDADEEPTSRAPQELYDGAAVEVATPTAADVAPAPAPRVLVDEDDIPLTWDPVPVPPPTYTMKARVTRPAPASADYVGDADTEYADAGRVTRFEQEPVRRVAGA